MRLTLSLLGTELISLRIGEVPIPSPQTDTSSHQGGSFGTAPRARTGFRVEDVREQ